MKHVANHSNARRRQRGLTIVELVFAGALFTLIIGTAWNAVFRSQIFFSEEMQQFAINGTERKVMDQIVEFLRRAAPSSVQPLILADSSSVQFQRVIGVDTDGLAILGPVITISHGAASGFTMGAEETQAPYASATTADVFDVSGEVTMATRGQLLLTVQGLPPQVLAENILGVRFNSLPNSISVSVDVGRLNHENLLLQRTFTRVVSFRNNGS